MLDALSALRKDLPLLLRDGPRWRCLAINYHPPRVDRMWTQVDDLRLHLHRIWPCAPTEALRHKHRWRSAVLVHATPGVSYRMVVGVGDPRSSPEAITLVASGELAYEMLNPDGWHSVAPDGGPSMSMMVTAPPWEGSVETEQVPPLGPLDVRQETELLSWFRARYL